MPYIVHVEYKQTGQSKSTNQYGMREMQEKRTLFEVEKRKRKINKNEH